MLALPILLGIYSCDNNRDNYDEIESISPFKIDSVKGKDRVFTELARKTVEKNNPKISSIKEAQKTNNYAKFDRIRAEREQKTPQHNRQKTI